MTAFKFTGVRFFEPSETPHSLGARFSQCLKDLRNSAISTETQDEFEKRSLMALQTKDPAQQSRRNSAIGSCGNLGGEPETTLMSGLPCGKW